jgi:hypothetical protein
VLAANLPILWCSGGDERFVSRGKTMHTRTIIFALAAAGVLFGSQAISQEQQPPPPPLTDAIIVNTPLPVTVTNPTSTVNVGNSAALAAAVAKALGGVGTPVAIFLGNRVPCSFPCVPIQQYSVPVGQRLVIEFISSFGCINSDPPAHILATTNGIQRNHWFNVASIERVPFANLVKIYADPGSAVSLVGTCGELTLSGQLLTL